MTGKDYYQILGVDEKATTDEIKKAFKRLARQYHPDRNKAPDATDRFKEINEAFQVLSDETRRAEYDNFRRYGGMGGFGRRGPSGGGGGGGAGPMPGGFSGTSFDDLFGSLFGRGGGGGTSTGGFGGQPRARQRNRGDDARSSIRVPFDTALRGGSVTIRFSRQTACDTCKGSGAAPGSKVSTCSTCRGAGVVAMGGGPFTVQRPCNVCGGSGKLIESPCTTCDGAGLVVRPQEATVTIPRGVSDGQTIRLAGLGHAGPNGKPAGDLLLEIFVAERPGFRREGRQIHSDVTITIDDAALGCEMDVETVDGTVSLRVPPGTQPGATLRLRGKGYFHGGTDQRGDHMVHIRVEIPRTLNAAQRKALEAFRKASQ
ncbi:MAG: molecular chaperone DnaJ [Planctomycetota bacterium]